ncbi:DUF4868 domain-containing protein [Pontibacter qinzhouensis]|uniref:DUF4868 domain-containing protein n=1 Tax=Pontibacter qinzhouensis TaxID=2603253 RepID=A0A5C8J359_9BACT|nr:anti-phage protein KwaB [Pontibacter qinzhouensis]TXK28421.1 DUF4868 domain-containing protein [Pontibacter qinzhouensis]
MTLPELQQHITRCAENPESAGVVLYLVLSNGNEDDQLRIADISAEAAIELKSMLIKSLSEKFINNSELNYMPLSEADNRKNTAYYYDLEEKPDGVKVLDEVIGESDKPEFTFSNDDFNKIKGFVITIGTEENTIAIYKRHHQLNTMKADKTFSLFKSDHRFVKMDEDLIKLSKTIDFIQINDHLIISDLKALESSFGYDKVIKKQAEKTIEAIEAKGLLEDINVLNDMVQDIREAKKIMRIKSDSPVLQLPVPAVIAFVQSHKPIMKKFKISECGNKLKLETKISKKLFISLMNDDLLTSELTKLYYAGLAKDKMEIDEELSTAIGLV